MHPVWTGVDSGVSVKKLMRYHASRSSDGVTGTTGSTPFQTRFLSISKSTNGLGDASSCSLDPAPVPREKTGLNLPSPAEPDRQVLLARAEVQPIDT